VSFPENTSLQLSVTSVIKKPNLEIDNHAKFRPVSNFSIDKKFISPIPAAKHRTRNDRQERTKVKQYTYKCP